MISEQWIEDSHTDSVVISGRFSRKYKHSYAHAWTRQFVTIFSSLLRRAVSIVDAYDDQCGHANRWWKSRSINKTKCDHGCKRRALEPYTVLTTAKQKCRTRTSIASQERTVVRVTYCERRFKIRQNLWIRAPWVRKLIQPVTQAMDLYSSFQSVFFSEKFWMVENVTWEDFKNRPDDDIYIPQPRDLWMIFPMAVVIFCIRLLFERYFISLFPLY